MELELLENLIDLSDKASDLITEMTDKLEFVDAEFLTQEEFDNAEDCIYDAPTYMEFGKYGTRNEYAIMKIEKGGTLTVISRDESDVKKTIDLGNLDAGEIIYLCSCLSNLDVEKL